MFTLYATNEIENLVCTATSTDFQELIRCARKQLMDDSNDLHYAVIMEQRMHVIDDRSVTCSMEFRWHGHRDD